ncbi:MAG TPA: ABC transporter permease [Anaerolineales bacterium]|nr:ABC transporter permease [Anaerolineales bacterium]
MIGLLQLASKNIDDSAFRSWVVGLCAALVTGFAIGAALVTGGAQESLRRVQERLGADIMVIPSGNQTQVEHALLMGVPVNVWMPRAVEREVVAIPGVAAASSQLFLSTMRGASCCSVSDMFMIGYDPATDFTMRPWLERHLEGELQLGEAIGGRYVTIPDGRENILIYGYEIELVGNLEPTGSGLDQSMFFTFDTALEIARLSPMQAEKEMEIAPDSVSAVLVRVAEDADPHEVAARIERDIPGMTAIESTTLFRTQHEQTAGLRRSASALVTIAWVLSIGLVGLVTSMTIAERRREVAVLRALGASRTMVLGSLLAEVIVLVLASGVTAIAVVAFAIFLFRDLVIQITEVSFYYPSPLSLLGLALGVLALAVASVMLATLIPIWRLVYEEPGTAMKEW